MVIGVTLPDVGFLYNVIILEKHKKTKHSGIKSSIAMACKNISTYLKNFIAEYHPLLHPNTFTTTFRQTIFVWNIEAVIQT